MAKRLTRRQIRRLNSRRSDWCMVVRSTNGLDCTDLRHDKDAAKRLGEFLTLGPGEPGRLDCGCSYLFLPVCQECGGLH